MATVIKASPAPVNGIRSCVSCLAIYRQDFQRCPLDGGTLQVSANDPWIGATVGTHYVIDGFVGEGAMGRVYRAHRKDLEERRYAIKVMIGDYAATAQMRARFQLEAEHASKLAHPNVVGVVDYGATEHNVNYIVMDLVEGPSLGQIVQKGPMEPERVIRLARQLCEGLDHAHSRGMIHRDFKPDNILVVGDGELEVARIADFGLSLSIDKEVRLTTTGIVCTPAYAAPEQLRGHAIDHRVDLYALGTTLYEMLSGGQLPFNGDLDTSVRSKLMNDAPSVHIVAPTCPPALVSIVGRLLSSDPARRPRSAKAVLKALDAALAAPRAEIKTEPTLRLRSVAAATTPAPVDASDSSKLPNKVASTSPSEAGEVRASRRPSLARRMIQVFACGITLGGGLAYVGLRSPSDAAPAIEAIADHTTPALDALVETAPLTAAAVSPLEKLAGTEPPASLATVAEPAPMATVTVVETPPVVDTASIAERPPVVETPPVAATAPVADQTADKAIDKTVEKPAAKRAPRARRKAPPRGRRVQTSEAATETTSADLFAGVFEDDTERTVDAGVLRSRYSAIARQLKILDTTLGRENTEDLWDAFQTIRLQDAIATQERRDETASVLGIIQEAIIDRTPQQ